MSEPFRRRVERRSTALLGRLGRLPTWVPLAAVVGLTAAGLWVRGPAGALLLVVLAVLIGWLGYLSWPALPSNARLVRVVVVAVVAAAAVRQYTLH
jgi:hypothetical protein